MNEEQHDPKLEAAKQYLGDRQAGIVGSRFRLPDVPILTTWRVMNHTKKKPK